MDYEIVRSWKSRRPWVVDKGFGAPWFAIGALCGPTPFQECWLSREVEQEAPPLGATVSQVVLHAADKRAVLHSRAMPASCGDAVEAVAAGVWRAYGWTLTFRDALWDGDGDPFHGARPARPLSFDGAAAVWSLVKTQALSMPTLRPTETLCLARYARAGRCVRELDGVPVLDVGDGPGFAPRTLLFAVGCAFAAGRLDEHHLAPAGPWHRPAPVDGSASEALASLLPRCAAGVSRHELEENLQEALLWERQSLGVVAGTPVEELPASVRSKLWARVEGQLVASALIA